MREREKERGRDIEGGGIGREREGVGGGGGGEKAVCMSSDQQPNRTHTRQPTTCLTACMLPWKKQKVFHRYCRCCVTHCSGTCSSLDRP